MKIVKVDAEVPDKSGLFFDLVKAEFEVRNVSGERGVVYIVLEDEEDKDPLPIADLWVGKTLERTSLSITKERRNIYEKFVQGKPARIAALRTRLQVQPEPAYAYESDGVQVLAMEPAQKESWFTKLRKLW
jgi:hypothetical protein